MLSNIELYVFVVLGALASLLLNLNEAKAQESYKFTTFVRQNWLPTIVNIIVGCIICAAIVRDANPVIEMTNTYAVLIGAMAQQFFKKLCNIFMTSKQTFIGFNKHETISESDNADTTDL